MTAQGYHPPARALLAAACALLAACASGPTAAPPAPALRAVLISDLNAAYGSTTYPADVSRVVELITERWHPDLVLVAGDMVAGQSTALPDATVRAMWQAFDSVVAAPLRAARIPLVVTLGNHDASAYPAHARDRRLALEYWRGVPQVESPVPFVDREHFPLRYTAVFGEVFVVVWDGTRQESATDAELLDWLRGALASAPARAARHRVVLSHLPLYAVAEGRNRPGELLAEGDALRQELETWGATLFVSGHHHAYYPGRRGTLDLLHAGALGGGPRQLLGTGMPPEKTVSLLEFRPDTLVITTYRMHAETGALEPFPLEALPPVLCGLGGWVARRDLPPADTTCGGENTIHPGG